MIRSSRISSNRSPSQTPKVWRSLTWVMVRAWRLDGGGGGRLETGKTHETCTRGASDKGLLKVGAVVASQVEDTQTHEALAEGRYVFR